MVNNITFKSNVNADVSSLIYSEFASGNTLKSGGDYGHSINIISRNASEDKIKTVRNKTNEYARLSIFTNRPQQCGYDMLECEGWLQIEFFYNIELGDMVVHGWCNALDEKFNRLYIERTLDTDVNFSLQFQNGNVTFKGRDRYDASLGYAVYRIPFCFYKRIV